MPELPEAERARALIADQALGRRIVAVEDGDSYVEQVAPVAAQRGEPWLTFLSPGDMSGLLAEHGFGSIKHVRQRDTVEPAAWDHSDSLRHIDLSCLAHATVARGGASQ